MQERLARLETRLWADSLMNKNYPYLRPRLIPNILPNALQAKPIALGLVRFFKATISRGNYPSTIKRHLYPIDPAFYNHTHQVWAQQSLDGETFNSQWNYDRVKEPMPQNSSIAWHYKLTSFQQLLIGCRAFSRWCINASTLLFLLLAKTNVMLRILSFIFLDSKPNSASCVLLF